MPVTVDASPVHANTLLANSPSARLGWVAVGLVIVDSLSCRWSRAPRSTSLAAPFTGVARRRRRRVDPQDDPAATPQWAVRTRWPARQEAQRRCRLPPRRRNRQGGSATAVGALTAPSTGSSHWPAYSASMSWTRSAHGVMSKLPGGPRLSSTGRASCRSPKARSGPSAVTRSKSGIRRPSSGCPSPRS